eukprot:1159189-Pelagomonas_calceolata.AAC.8
MQQRWWLFRACEAGMLRASSLIKPWHANQCIALVVHAIYFVSRSMNINSGSSIRSRHATRQVQHEQVHAKVGMDGAEYMISLYAGKDSAIPTAITLFLISKDGALRCMQPVFQQNRVQQPERNSATKD